MTTEQKQLILCYYDCLEPKAIDGIWGTESTKATRKLQKLLGITEDGIWGKKTEAAVRERFYIGDDTTEAPEEKKATGTFWDSIKHFERSEFKCTCKGRGCKGYPVEPEEKLLRAADKVREHFNAKVIVTSGVRCTLRNSELPGSVPNSRHLSGKAMDFCVSGLSSSSVLPYVQSLPEIRYAYAIDSSAVHMDIN